MLVKFSNNNSASRGWSIYFLFLISLLICSFSSLTINTSASESVRLEGDVLVLEEVIEKARIENVPFGLSAEQARDLISGKVSEIQLNDDNDVRIGWFVPIVTEEYAAIRKVAYQGDWQINSYFEKLDLNWKNILTLNLFFYGPILLWVCIILMYRRITHLVELDDLGLGFAAFAVVPFTAVHFFVYYYCGVKEFLTLLIMAASIVIVAFIVRKQKISVVHS